MHPGLNPAPRPLWAGSVFAATCAGPYRPGAVHSVFSRAVNLKTPDGLLTLAARDTGRAARTLLLDLKSFSGFPLEPGQSCVLTPEELSAGPLRVPLNDLPLWQPEPPESAGDSPAAVSRFRETLNTLRPGAGLHTGREPALLAALKEPDTAKNAVRGLVGLGPGLTPAGDDLLAGALAKLTVKTETLTERERRLSDIIRIATRECLPRTSDVSAQMLADACEGLFHEFLWDAALSLLRGPGSVEAALPRLLSVGASSGADMAAGLLLFS